jgi:hypothetical protein
MRGVHGRTGWFYLFLIEGLLTLGIGIIVSIMAFHLPTPVYLLINHEEPALFAPISYKHEKHIVPEIMVHRTSGSNHDQRKSTGSTYLQNSHTKYTSDSSVTILPKALPKLANPRLSRTFATH